MAIIRLFSTNHQALGGDDWWSMLMNIHLNIFKTFWKFHNLRCWWRAKFEFLIPFFNKFPNKVNVFLYLQCWTKVLGHWHNAVNYLCITTEIWKSTVILLKKRFCPTPYVSPLLPRPLQRCNLREIALTRVEHCRLGGGRYRASVVERDLFGVCEKRN